MKFTSPAMEYSSLIIIRLEKSELLYAQKFRLNINDDDLEDPKICIITPNRLLIAESVGISIDTIDINVIYELDPKWYYLSFGVVTDIMGFNISNTMILRGKNTRIGFRSDKLANFITLRKYLRYFTIQRNFDTEFTKIKILKQKYKESSFSHEDSIIRKYFFVGNMICQLSIKNKNSI